ERITGLEPGRGVRRRLRSGRRGSRPRRARHPGAPPGRRSGRLRPGLRRRHDHGNHPPRPHPPAGRSNDRPAPPTL
ncbi:MAG: hypothetical protein AVDCRST_MAG89-4792, partial [uncultured Gemmatimonadetes bacterium]